MSSRRRKPRKRASAIAPAALASGRADPAVPLPRAERRADGRFHLALVVDQASGRERLDLVRPVFVEDWQNRLTAAAANTAYAILRDERSVRSAARLGKAAMESTSTLVGGLLARTPPGSVACHAGCDHCCYQSVGVTPPEAIAIHAYLVETWTLPRLTSLQARLGPFVEQVRGLTSDERASPELPCPFLEQGTCTIYEVRPLACRGVNSLDAEACRRYLHEPAARAAGASADAGGHLLIAPIRAFNAISAGLQLGLAEQFGLDMRPLDLAFSLELLFRSEAEVTETSGGLQGRWVAGEPSFASARGGDAGRDPSRLELVGARSDEQPVVPPEGRQE